MRSVVASVAYVGLAGCLLTAAAGLAGSIASSVIKHVFSSSAERSPSRVERVMKAQGVARIMPVSANVQQKIVAPASAPHEPLAVFVAQMERADHALVPEPAVVADAPSAAVALLPELPLPRRVVKAGKASGKKFTVRHGKRARTPVLASVSGKPAGKIKHSGTRVAGFVARAPRPDIAAGTKPAPPPRVFKFRYAQTAGDLMWRGLLGKSS